MRAAVQKAVSANDDLKRYVTAFLSYLKGCVRFLNRHRIGALVILLATIVFFFPIIIRLGSYSPGGDAMFNAWEMSRNQHCILQQHCPVYADANIFYPNKDTMLYSETQLSAAVVTLPFHWLDQNPILQYNFLTIVLFFMTGWCMYLLAKYLSRGNEPMSIAAGLIFEFAPFKMAAIWHLQNLSIFCLPLAVLLILKYFDSGRRKYLYYLLPTLLYVFFASWVQMVFMLLAIGILLVGLLTFKVVSWRPALKVVAITAIAALTTLPLALQFVQFSKANHATFSVIDQELYGSSLADYFIPYGGTLLGKVYYAVRPHAQVNAYNLDSNSYHGIVLYVVGLAVVVLAYRQRKTRKVEDKRRNALIFTLFAIAVVGFLISLGPFLKIKGSYIYPGLAGGLPVVIPAPYAIVDKLLPQLDFIRAVGRASVLVLFALCCFLALLPAWLVKLRLTDRLRYVLLGTVYVLMFVELIPIHTVPMSAVPQTYNLTIPAVYTYVSAHKQIDDIAILQSNDDYPGASNVAWLENILWSGYYNRNIFNGYSGYFPPAYMKQYVDFVDFNAQTSPVEMKSLGIKYVIINKDLSGPKSNRPYLLPNVSKRFPTIYQDSHYALFKVT